MLPPNFRDNPPISFIFYFSIIKPKSQPLFFSFFYCVVKCKSKCNTKQKSVAITSAQSIKLHTQSVAIKNAQEVE